MRKNLHSLVLALSLMLMLFTQCQVLKAAGPTDEILNFTIEAVVEEDASLTMQYHIDWKVLDSDSLGPLEWVEIGLPNGHFSDVTGISDNIEKINTKSSSVEIYFDKKYYEDEIVSFDFSFHQKNLYQIDKYTEGETVYAFTPAWFDEIAVDQLTIRWKSDKAISWQPDCVIDGDWLVFETSLSPKERYTMSVNYSNDAYGFNKSEQASGDDGFALEDIFYLIIAGVLFLLFLAFPFVSLGLLIWFVVSIGRGFGNRPRTKKVITRTKIVYYDFCPGCGAPKQEGKEVCAYCGRDMIKSKEIIEEKDIDEPEKYTSKGLYRYGNSSNTYISVNVKKVKVPAPPRKSKSTSSRSRSTSSRSSSSSRGSSSGHSCACACASSCACACACASSGRAGCSVKDFFDQEVYENKWVIDRKE